MMKDTAGAAILADHGATEVIDHGDHHHQIGVTTHSHQGLDVNRGSPGADILLCRRDPNKLPCTVLFIMATVLAQREDTERNMILGTNL